jgi:putative inorganic carbon (HCO3(-)) transporter
MSLLARPRLRVAEAALVLVLPLVGLGVGYGLVTLAASLAGRFHGPAGLGPALVVLVPLAPALVVAVLADPRIAVVATFATIPVGTMHVGPLPVQLIIVVVAAFTAIVALRRLAAGEGLVGWAPELSWLLALLVWSLIGFPKAIDRALAIRQIAQLGGGLLYACLIVAACRTAKDVRMVVAGILGISFFIAVSGIAGGHQLQSQYGGSYVAGRAQGVFTQPNELGTFCAPLALLAMAAAVTVRGRLRWLAGACALALIVALALSLSRGAWIGFGLGSLLLLITLPTARRTLLVLTPVLLLIAVGMGAFAPTNPQVQVIGARLKSISGEKNPYDDRPAIWAEARREILAHPFLGEGAGGFPAASVTATSEARTTYASHAHNLLLTWAAETGLPGAALILAFVVQAGWAMSRARRALLRSGRPMIDLAMLTGVAAGLVAVLGSGLVDYTLRNSSIFVSAFGLIGLLLAASRAALRPASA